MESRMPPWRIVGVVCLGVLIADLAASPAAALAQSGPCCGTALRIPGLIEAEYYDAGGEGIAYHDADAANHGGAAAYRPSEGVDTRTSVDGGYEISWTTAGEWLKYTVQIDRTADYSIHARVASPGGGTFHLDIDGANVTGPMTAGAGAYRSVSRIPVRLTAGARVLRLVVDSGTVDFQHLHIREVVPRGNRVLGMDTSNNAESAAPLDAFMRAQAAGAESTSVSLNWDQIEPTPGQYVDPYGVLAAINSFYPSHNMRVSLTIRPIDGYSKPVPPDLRDKLFGDQVMLERFTRMLVWVLGRLPNATLTSLQIGNEIDHYYLDMDWGGYASLLFWSNYTVKWLRPDIKVGFTATWYGLTHTPTKEALLWLKPHVDVIGVTYYPLDSNLQVRSPRVVQGDFDALMSGFGDKLVFLQEAGYPSGPLSSSSEAKQNDFVQEVFAAWDRYSDRIGYLSFVRMQDWSQAQADAVATGPPYYIPHPEFSEYLRTVGFRTHPGTGVDKPSLSTLTTELDARGW